MIKKIQFIWGHSLIQPLNSFQCMFASKNLYAIFSLKFLFSAHMLIILLLIKEKLSGSSKGLREKTSVMMTKSIHKTSINNIQ